MMLKRASRSIVRRCITSILMKGTITSKHLSITITSLFGPNSKIAVAPGISHVCEPRSCNVSSGVLRGVSEVTVRKVGTGTCPNYRVLVLGSKGPMCSGSFNAFACRDSQGIRGSSLCSLTSLAGAATALLTIVGLCSRKGFNLASHVSRCVPTLGNASGRHIAVRRLLLRRSNVPTF